MKQPSFEGSGRWVFHGAYGQYRTAESVAFLLRRHGWKATIVQDEHGNVSVWKMKRNREGVR